MILAESVGLAFVVLLVLGRSHLGLRYPGVVDGILAAALLLLLAHRVGWLLVALRPALGARSSDRPPLSFLLLPLIVYLAILPWSTRHRPPDGDEPYYLLMTHSLAYDLDAGLSNNYESGDSLAFMDRRIEPQVHDPVGPDGEIYSRHTVLLPLALAPAYRVAGKAGALACMAFLTAWLAWWTLRLARRYFPERDDGALFAYAIVAFAPPLLFYSYQVWVEVPAALLVAIALYQVDRLGSGSSGAARHWLTLIAAIVLLPLLKIRFMLVAGPLLLLAGWRARRSRRATLLALALLAVTGAAILGYNAAVYGNPLKVQRWESLLGLAELPPQDYLRGPWGLLLDCAFGLASSAPIWLLLVPALLVVLLRHRRFAADSLVVSLPYMVVLAPRLEWYGGWGPLFRYALVLLPLLGVALVPLLDERSRSGRRALLSGLGGATVALTLLATVVPGWTYQLATGSSDLLELASHLQGADLTRLLPSYVRPRPATWIWPLVVVAAAALWWWPRRLPRGGAWGVATLLASCTLLLGAAHGLPTRRIEAEDRYVEKSGGELHPQRWMRTRVRFRSGWALSPGDRLVAPVVAGGTGVRLTLDLRAEGASSAAPVLTASCGNRQIAAIRPRLSERWQRLELGPFEWRAGEALALELVSSSATGPSSRILLDGIDLRWHQGRETRADG